MAKLRSYGLIYVFFGMLLLPVISIGFDFGSNDYARGDFPSSLSRQTPRELERWFTTRLGYRSLRMKIGAFVQFRLFDRSTSPLVVQSEDGWLFTADSGDMSGPPPRVSDFRGSMRLSENAIAQIDERLIHDRDALNRCGMTFVALAAPNKQSIYGDRLAKGGWPTQTRLSDLIAKLSPEARGILEDPRSDMVQFKAAHPAQLLYHKTGSHWTDLGAWVAYKNIIDRLAAKGAVFAPDRASLDNFYIEVTKINGINMDVVVRYAKDLFSDSEVRLVAKDDVSPVKAQSSSEPLIPFGFEKTEYTNAKGQGRLIYFGDSFGARLVPLLARHFADVIYFDYPFLNNGVIVKYKPTVVVLESIERNIEKLGEQTTRLSDACPR